jgi:carbon-monoxide dehydrogenase medium subunit
LTAGYVEPNSVDDAVRYLHDYGPDARLLAGGITFFPLGVPRGLVVGLRRVAELRGIRDGPDGLWIGGLITHRRVETSTEIRARAPMLSSAFSEIGSVRIRAQGTIGGNLALCDPVFDPPPALIALDAVVTLAGAHRTRREVSVETLVDEAQGGRLRATVIAGIRIPPVASGTRAAYRKVRARSAAGGPIVCVAAALRLDADCRVEHIRIALGAVCHSAVRATKAEDFLLGRPCTPDILQAAADLAGDEVTAQDDLRGSADYKQAMTRVWVRRILEGLST